MEVWSSPQFMSTGGQPFTVNSTVLVTGLNADMLDGLHAADIVSGGISDGDKGDITVSGSGVTWTIDNDVVTFAKMQNSSSASVLVGRGSAGGAGDFQEITLGAGLSMSGTTLVGNTGTVTGPGSSTDNGIATWNGVAGTVLKTTSVTLSAGILTQLDHANMYSLYLRDSDDSHDLIITAGSNLTANHTFQINTGDADRTLTLGGNATLNGGTHSGTNTGDQTLYNQTVEDEGTPVTQRSVINFVGAGVSVADTGGKTTVTISGGAGVSDGDTLATGLTFPIAGLHILDTNASHDLIISPGSDLSADRTLTITTGDADRTLTINSSTTLGGGTHSGTNTGDQGSIVGITGTMAQFDTAVTDGNFAYTNSANTFTAAQTINSGAAGYSLVCSTTEAVGRISVNGVTNGGIELQENGVKKWTIATYASGTFTFYNEAAFAEAISISSANAIGLKGPVTCDSSLVVDTTTLVVDSANNRVGIGTAGPSYPLHIVTAASALQLLLDPGATNNSADIGSRTDTGLRLFGGTSYNTGPAFQIWPTGSAFQGMYFDAGSASGANIIFRDAPSGTAMMTLSQGASGIITISRQLSSTASGAPIIVTSTTVCTNLNADLLDGQEGSYYRDATNINAGTLDNARLDTQLQSLAGLSYTGNALKVVRVNAGENAFEVATLAGGGDLLSTNNLSDVANAATAFGNIKQAASTTATGVVELATDAEAQGIADTTRAITASNLAAMVATQADQETGTALDRFVTPGRQHNHPSAAKFWADIAGAGNALNASYNVTSLTDTGDGDVSVVIATDFSAANYAVVASVERSNSTTTVTNSKKVVIKNATQAVGSVSLQCWDSTATNNVIEDPTSYYVVGFGDQ